MIEQKRVRVSDRDIETALRLARKIALLLERKGKNCVSTYLALKILLLDFEEHLGVSMNSDDEKILKAFVKRLP